MFLILVFKLILNFLKFLIMFRLQFVFTRAFHNICFKTIDMFIDLIIFQHQIAEIEIENIILSSSVIN